MTENPHASHQTKENNSQVKKPDYYVGIGASAGGLESLCNFFKNMHSPNNLSFIVIQHLSPDYKSLMQELLSKHASMPVYRSEDGMDAQANSIYLIPPSKNMKIFHGKILLMNQDRSAYGINLPIDIFFRSLAEDQGQHAIGIVLSGTGSDGTRGIRSIKEVGGMVMVQSEESAKFDGMPRSAISTGCADYILTPEEMSAQLISFVKHPYAAREKKSDSILTNETGLTRLFSMIREKHKIDFTDYKPNTVLRRVERRMTVRQIKTLDEYIDYCNRYSNEITCLYKDMLIGVTRFFRDYEAFNLLKEKYIPELLKKKKNQMIRVWDVGCSSGEEAYSLAMLFQDCIEKTDHSFDIKIFATDADKDAVLQSSQGIFSSSIVMDLMPEYLAKYFIKKDDNYHIVRHIREMIVFAQHNVVKDPPFTNIDLVSCRNLLIYLQPVLQKKALEYFNFSLKEKGILFLGHSESIGEMSDYFDSLEPKWKIYQSKGKRKHTDIDQDRRIPLQIDQNLILKRQSQNSPSRFNEEELLLKRLITVLSDDYTPFSVIVNDNNQIVYLLKDDEGFIRHTLGGFSPNITKIADKRLSIPLSTGLQKAFESKKEVVYTNIHLKQDDTNKLLKMRIRLLPEKKGQNTLALISLQEIFQNEMISVSNKSINYDLSEGAQQRIRDLEQELQFFKENLQATVEELETSNEELQATNEELLASNEELQSTNEELQSVNEELYTVNAEHQQKIMELTTVNSDLDNILNNVKIGIIILDEHLEIRRFTKEVNHIYKILDSDIGRSITHLSHNLMNFNLRDIVKSVMITNQMEEHEVHSENGKSYLMQVLPYCLTLDHYSGVIISFKEITNLYNIQKELSKARKQAELSNDSKSNFVKRLSHGIRTPLNAISSYSNTLSTVSSNFEVLEFKETIEQIQKNSNFLTGLLNTTLDLSKIEAGKFPVVSEDVNLKKLVKESYDFHKSIARQKKLDYTYYYSRELPDYVVSDYKKLFQILINLLDNAVKFTPENRKIVFAVKKGNFKFSTKDETNLTENEMEHPSIFIQIEDEGIGIPEACQHTIFEPFEQASETIQQQFGGYGLGLAVTMQLVELLGGNISYTSQEQTTNSDGKIFSGCTIFTVHIPLKESSIKPIKPQPTKKWDHYQFSSKSLVLVADDILTDQKTIQNFLSRLGVSVILSNNGQEIIDKTLKLVSDGTPPDLILMDLHMAPMDGIEASKIIIASPGCKNIPIVALTADAFKRKQKEAISAGIKDYLLKPIQVEKLVSVLKKFL